MHLHWITAQDFSGGLFVNDEGRVMLCPAEMPWARNKTLQRIKRWTHKMKGTLTLIA